ncbi:MAG: putative membrane protein [Spirosomataceae bacterium]|jgi:uncharacterized membrane protein
MNFELIGLYVMSGFYVFAGVVHFIRPKFFLAIVPPYVPNPKAMVIWSGIFEVTLGLGLLSESRRSFAATGIILLLIAVFPANLYMAYGERFQKISPLIRWGRLPLQLVLAWWAYQYV